MKTLNGQIAIPESLTPEGVQLFNGIPSGYSLQNIVSRGHNKRRITVYRYQKEGGEDGRLGGEHFSLSLDAARGNLLGLMWMDARFASQEPPSESEATEVATRFLSITAPELLPDIEVLWIREHTETITANGHEVQISGMKYKTRRRSHGDYAWVIVGHGGEIITFERDILWRGRRLTEKWLHDEYCAKHYKHLHR